MSFSDRANTVTQNEYAKGIAVLAGYGITWQILASLLYATQEYIAIVHPHEINWLNPPNWHFWFFWNDYWIFLPYLNWPGRNGTEWAVRANAIAAILAGVLVLAAILALKSVTRGGSE